jgi:predicted nucleic acid-binding protein
VAAALIADKSALVRLGQPQAIWLVEQILGGNVARCGIIDLELYYSATSHRDLVRLRSDREAAFAHVDTGEQDLRRAAAVLEELSRSGHHRAVRLPDLVIAAVAERHGLTVVHYDADFDHIRRVTDQPMRWLAPRGTW